MRKTKINTMISPLKDKIEKLESILKMCGESGIIKEVLKTEVSHVLGDINSLIEKIDKKLGLCSYTSKNDSDTRLDDAA
jgi:hypothetical protein